MQVKIQWLASYIVVTSKCHSHCVDGFVKFGGADYGLQH